MERRLDFALGRFGGRISQVTVGLEDLNGPRGGADKRCRLAVRLVPSGKVTIEETKVRHLPPSRWQQIGLAGPWIAN